MRTSGSGYCSSRASKSEASQLARQLAKRQGHPQMRSPGVIMIAVVVQMVDWSHDNGMVDFMWLCGGQGQHRRCSPLMTTCNVVSSNSTLLALRCRRVCMGTHCHNVVFTTRKSIWSLYSPNDFSIISVYNDHYYSTCIWYTISYILHYMVSYHILSQEIFPLLTTICLKNHQNQQVILMTFSISL